MLRALAYAVAALLVALGGASAGEPTGDRERGLYILYAGACDSCHTDHANDGRWLAGGRSLETQFGTFYMPNITPDPQTGIGGWSFAGFRAAMVDGVRPDGSHYYPVFPYAWYTGMTEQDLADLWAYLRTVEPVRNAVRPHDLPFPYDIRLIVLGWKLLNFDRGFRVVDEKRGAAWNRGAYLVNHLGHCGACHTPKDRLGSLLTWRFLAGSERIPGPYPAPNITPDPVDGIGGWSEDDIVRALRRSMTPHGTPIRGPMAEYVISGSSHLSEPDLRAIAVYLKSIEPRSGPVPEHEERRDRRLGMAEGYEPGERAGTGAVGMGLLRLSSGGRTRAK